MVWALLCGWGREWAGQVLSGTVRCGAASDEREVYGKAWQDMARYCFQVDGLDLCFPWYKRMQIDLWRPLRQWVYERDNGRCQYCDGRVELYGCHIHHVLELNQGGTNHPSNLKTLCVGCHKERHPFMKTAKEKYLVVVERPAMVE